MKNLDDSSIKALISLLEDPNEQIYYEIHQTILALGVDGISHLQTAFEESEDDLQKERIVHILDDLKLKKLNEDLSNWSEFNSDDLLSGLILIARYGHPNLDVKAIEDTINEMVEAIKGKVEGRLPGEIINVFNQTILYDFGFNGNIRNYSGINNSFINKVIENKISNPIGLSILYLLIAERLNIPLVGINSPEYFILGYVGDSFTYEDVIDGTVTENIDFYIDPFNNGSTLKVEDFDAMLLSIPYALEDKKVLPATNKDIVKRVMNNLIYALFTTGEKDIAQDLLEINESL